MGLTVESQIPGVIGAYGLSSDGFKVSRVGSGYIHYTFELNGNDRYILQRVNKNVFKKPEVIAENIRLASEYLKKKYPDYLFLTAVKSTSGQEMVYDTEGFPWRLFPYVDNTFTVDKVSTESEALSAAAEFGRLTRYLDGIDTRLFKPTIDRFHDLSWRWEQFESSLKKASPERLKNAALEVERTKSFRYLVDEYRSLINSGSLKPRITHNDTKINNILFDSVTGKAVCAIDLDTLMPGYFIYDLGDMIRTFVSPVDEEEKDLIPFSGMMMTYIMELRMLADYLNGDIYYVIKYEGQNLVRARNQLTLLEELSKVK
jgi:Ser/Thr protein kinase RdoA (MazF antagonist)